MKVHVDDREVQRKLKELERQIPFGVAKGINRTAEQVQAVQRQHQRRVFTVRRPAFVDRGVKISQFANKRVPVARIEILPPGGADRASILTQHEPGGTKRPKDGRSLSVPHAARRGKRDLVPQVLRPKNLELVPHGRSGRVLVGKERTVLIRGAGGQGGLILQRQGPRNKRGQKDSRDHRYRSKVVARKGSTLVLLYRLAIRAKISPRLRFHENARQVVRQSLARNVTEAVRDALATAR